MRLFTLLALSTVVAVVLAINSSWADIDSDVVDGLAMKSFRDRKPALDKANEAALTKGITLEGLAKACNPMPVRVGAVLTGQAPLEKKSLDCLANQLGVQQKDLEPLLKPPVRWNAGGIYRLHEAVDVYGPAAVDGRAFWCLHHVGDRLYYGGARS